MTDENNEMSVLEPYRGNCEINTKRNYFETLSVACNLSQMFISKDSIY